MRNDETRRRPAARIAMAALLAFGVCLLTASQVAGHHSPNALYTGTHSAGGAVEFNLNADGTLITRFKIVDVPCDDPNFTYDSEVTFSGGGIPVTNHVFSYGAAEESFSGSFPANQSATGSFQAHGASGCPGPAVSWSATTAAPPPQCADGADNDGDGKVDLGSDPGCSGDIDNDEADPPDITAPVAPLSGKKTQKAGKRVKVVVSCPNEACAAKATGSVLIRPASGARALKLRAAKAQIPSGGKATLKLKVPRRTLRAVRRALSRRAKVSAKLKVVARDGAGNRTVKRRAIKLV